MIVINESTGLTLKPINEDTNEITISSYDKEGNEHSTIIILTGAEKWKELDQQKILKDFKEIKDDWYISCEDMNKLIEEMVNSKQIIYNPKKKANHNWKKDKFWK